jgi:hypothetical protein
MTFTFPPPPPPISIEEVEKLSEKQLRVRVNEWFAYLAVCGNEQRAGVVAQAEFYMRELARRENAEIAARDYTMTEEDRSTNARIAERDFNMARRSERMERLVVALIGLEIVIALVGLWYAVHEGSKQQIVLEQMGKNTSDTAHILSGQGEVLGKMNTNTHDTVDAVGNLQKVQNESLGAQNRTLGSIGKMNASLQQQLDLAFTVSVAVTADQEGERIIVANLTKTAIYVSAVKFDGEPPLKLSDERFIGPSISYFFKFEKLFEKARTTTPKGSPAHQISLDFYLLSADGKPWVARGFLSEVWEGDAVKIYPNTISVKQEAWPPDVK